MQTAVVQVWDQEDTGQLGEPVVLVHGSGDTHPAFVWQHQRPLAHHRSCSS